MSSPIRITRREAIAAAAMVPAALMSRAEAAAAPSKPNIVYIMADDMGYADVSCYGRPEYTTPNIDRLAAGGMKFMQAYANSAVCTATRVALITGRYQYRLPVGLEEPLNGGSRENMGLAPSNPTIPSLMKKAGYATTLVGKWHLGSLPDYGPLKSGYDHFWGFRGGSVDYFTHGSDLWDGDAKIEEAGYLTELLGNRAVKEITAYAKAKQPFFMSLHFNAPHWPWEGPGDEALSKQSGGRGGGAYDAGTQKIYGDVVKALDVQVGRIMKTLETAGIAKNTIVVFTSDNGGERFSDTWPFTGKKTELLEGGLRIPCIVHWPDRIKPRSVTEQTSMSMDWLPTFVAAAGGQTDPAFPPDGMNLLPVLTQNAAPVSRKLYWRFKSRSQRAMRDGNMKWLKINDNQFLFNVVDDPQERANLNNRQPEVFARMAAEYDAWNATMLPEDPGSNSDGFSPTQLADHFNTAEQAGGRGGGRGPGGRGGGRGPGRGPSTQ